MANEEKLTAKQKRFCEEYIIDWNGTRAAIAAGYSKKTAYSIAHENLRKASISNYIKSIKDEAVTRINEILNKKKALDNGFVYLIHCEGTDFYKIGKTRRDVRHRLNSLQGMNPFKLVIVATVEVLNSSLVEKELQDFYKDRNVRGEWFRFNVAEVNAVAFKIKNYKEKR